MLDVTLPVLWRRPGVWGWPHKVTITETPAKPILLYTEANGNEAGLQIPFSVFGSETAWQNPDGQGLEGGDSFCVTPATKRILPVP